jgi:hypothetical protein
MIKHETNGTIRSLTLSDRLPLARQHRFRASLLGSPSLGPVAMNCGGENSTTCQTDQQPVVRWNTLQVLRISPRSRR